jgi:hypothetical protein
VTVVFSDCRTKTITVSANSLEDAMEVADCIFSREDDEYAIDEVREVV